jgi:predicted enzyme related to lactoylglutathione lyase
MSSEKNSAVTFQSISPIGDTDTNALPVQEIGAAVTYYTQVLGFTVVSRNEDSAVLTRDAATIGLKANGADPEQASCYFAVSDVDTLRAELSAKNVDVSPTRVDEHNGKSYRVFFAKEPYGVCFCFGQAMA